MAPPTVTLDSSPYTAVAPPKYDEAVGRSPRSEREMSLERHVANLISKISDERETAVLQSQRVRFYMDQRDEATRHHCCAKKAAYQRLLALKAVQAGLGVQTARNVQLAEYGLCLARADASSQLSNLILFNLQLLTSEIQRIYRVGKHNNEPNMLAVHTFPTVEELMDQSSFRVVPFSLVDAATAQYQAPQPVPNLVPVPAPSRASTLSNDSASPATFPIAGPVAPSRRGPASTNSHWSFSSDDLVYPREDSCSPSPMELEENSRSSTPAGYSKQGSAGIRSS
ncbi:hypothetical protein EV361DRAFT_955373 [Lentinula raphanica]|nr:hypothetical protein EV361DRAFT_955373 [Lentinula raphanica]